MRFMTLIQGFSTVKELKPIMFSGANFTVMTLNKLKSDEDVGASEYFL